MLASYLPPNPSLEQLRKQAKEFRDLVRTGHAKFTEPVRRLHPRLAQAPPPSGWAGFTLADAQLVVARAYGFPSWKRLREHLDRLTRYSRSPQRRPTDPVGAADEFLRLACLTYRVAWRADPGEEPDDPGRPTRARQLLAEHPELASASIYTAAAVGDVAAARAWLAADPAIAGRDGGPHRWPPLLYAAFSRVDTTQAGHSTLEVAGLLLEHGADPNAGYVPDGDPPPVTALSGAFRGQDPINQPAHPYGPQLARMLLDAGADPNDQRALDHAGRYPHDDGYLPLFLSYGLGRGSGGPWRARLGHVLPTPAALVEDELRYAAMMDRPERVRLLLRHRAELDLNLDATVDAPEGPYTAHDMAVLAGNADIAERLAAVGARVRPLEPVDQLLAACMRADHTEVQRLLTGDQGLAQRAVGTQWAVPFAPNPLHFAALFGRADAVRLLASVGFPVNDRRLSPLHVAALAGHLDLVRLLVELGSDPTAEAVDDETPGQFSPPDRTPLGWARYNRQDHVVAYLSGITA